MIQANTVSVPVLYRAQLQTHTGNDNKDHDTGIYVVIRTADGGTQLASCSNADSSGNDSTEYNDGSDHTVDLRIDAPGILYETCKGFKVHMWQQPNGHDTWKVTPTVILYFMDGTNLVASTSEVALVNGGASVDFTNK